MNIEYCKGTPADRQEILDFADLVFSKNSRPHDFATLLPKLYGPDRNFEPLHYMVKEDGKIRAMICVLPMEFRSGEETLRFNGVGTVSVHPCARGRGYMKKLMAWALEDMKQDGTVFSTLSGLRQRYEYFGYTPVGRKLSWNLNRDNLRHRYAGRAFAPVVLSPMTRQDAPVYAAMYRKSGPGTVRSDEDFLTILRSWNAQPTAVTLEGKPVGYFCRTGGTIQEMVLENPELLPDVLHAIFQNPEVEWLSLFLPEWETGLSAILEELAEGVHTSWDHNCRIFDFAKAVKVFLQIKADYTPLPDGTLTFAVEGASPFTVTVQQGTVSVHSASPEETGLSLSQLTAARLFFAPEGWRAMPEAKNNLLLRSWLPAPLFTGEQDNC